ncbi:MAG: HAD-IA family hydrolase [Actinomycetota bacterium]
MRAILFDLDGVLVDSTAHVRRAWIEWAETKGLDPETVVEAAHGRRTVETIATVAPDLDPTEEARLLEDAEVGNTAATRPMDGAKELIASLAPERWAIVTSGTRPLAEGRIRGAGLPLPEVLITAGDVDRGKPDPEGYLAAARALEARPPDCVVIEDTPTGIEATRRGGMAAIAVTSTYPEVALAAADLVVPSLGALRVSSSRDGLVHIGT